MSKKRFPANDPERRSRQDPETILQSIGLRKGMTFVDAGCGEGFFALPAAKIVGPEGRVYAFDINPESVAALNSNAAAEGLTNISAEARPAEEAVSCNGCADIVFFGIDLHDFHDPAQVIRNAKVMLRPGGRLIDLDWKDIRMDFGPPFEKRFSVIKARGLIEAGGFSVISVGDAGPYHYLIVAGT